MSAIKTSRIERGEKAQTRVEEVVSREGDSFGGAEGLTVEAYMARKRKAKVRTTLHVLPTLMLSFRMFGTGYVARGARASVIVSKVVELE